VAVADAAEGAGLVSLTLYERNRLIDDWRWWRGKVSFEEAHDTAVPPRAEEICYLREVLRAARSRGWQDFLLPHPATGAERSRVWRRQQAMREWRDELAEEAGG
jgi:hypothetical protein